LETILVGCKEFTDFVEPRFSSEIIEANLLDAPVVPKMDLMVCSPPYPNAFSYHLYHMTRMLWLGMNQKQFKSQEIGSHRKYSSKGKNAATVATFQAEFQSIMNWLNGQMTENGVACFIMGDSTLRGERIDNTQIISDCGKRAGFRELRRIERTLQATKKSFNPSIGRIKTETILILEKWRGA
jgi:site-specific DNA-methyltransferase (cytosine-N4-specific)